MVKQTNAYEVAELSLRQIAQLWADQPDLWLVDLYKRIQDLKPSSATKTRIFDLLIMVLMHVFFFIVNIILSGIDNSDFRIGAKSMFVAG